MPCSTDRRRLAGALELAEVAVADRADAAGLDGLEPGGGAEEFGVGGALLPGAGGRLHLGGLLAAVDEDLAHLARRYGRDPLLPEPLGVLGALRPDEVEPVGVEDIQRVGHRDQIFGL